MLTFLFIGSNIIISNKSTNFREVQNNDKSRKHYQQQWQRNS